MADPFQKISLDSSLDIAMSALASAKVSSVASDIKDAEAVVSERNKLISEINKAIQQKDAGELKPSTLKVLEKNGYLKGNNASDKVKSLADLKSAVDELNSLNSADLAKMQSLAKKGEQAMKSMAELEKQFSGIDSIISNLR